MRELSNEPSQQKSMFWKTTSNLTSQTSEKSIKTFGYVSIRVLLLIARILRY